MGNDILKMLNLEPGSLTASGMLRNARFFHGLTQQQLDAVARIGRVENYPEGSRLYELGDAAIDFFILGRGAVRFTIGNGDFQPSAGQIIRPGEVFGWAALVEQSQRRIATATCLTNSTLLAVAGTELIQLMDADHDLGYLLMKQLNSLVTNNLTAFAAG